MKELEGILFDVGDTLTYPIGGSWFPGSQFYPICAKHGVVFDDPAKFKAAMQKGLDYLDAHHFLQTEEEEEEQCRQFGRILFDAMGTPNATDALVAELARARIEAPEWELFSDTMPVLERLQKRGFLMGIVSDTFPSFERRITDCGMRPFFNGPIVISAKVGCFKPNPRIYEIAIERAGLAPNKLVFIDNYLENVMGAVRLGMHGVLIVRDGPLPEAPVPVVRDLEQFEALLK